MIITIRLEDHDPRVRRMIVDRIRGDRKAYAYRGLNLQKLKKLKKFRPFFDFAQYHISEQVNLILD